MLEEKPPLVQVELWCGTIPYLSKIALHYWFFCRFEKMGERWEVWQLAQQNQSCWGHIHRNLFINNNWLKNQSSWKETQWQGQVATNIYKQLIKSTSHYPHINKYRAWPGPNSNSYVQYILNQAKTNYLLPPMAIGKDHQQWFTMKKHGDFYQIYSPLMGFKFNSFSHFELHFLGFTLGLQTTPWRLLTPLTHFGSIEHNQCN